MQNILYNIISLHGQYYKKFFCIISKIIQKNEKVFIFPTKWRFFVKIIPKKRKTAPLIRFFLSIVFLNFFIFVDFNKLHFIAFGRFAGCDNSHQPVENYVDSGENLVVSSFFRQQIYFCLWKTFIKILSSLFSKKNIFHILHKRHRNKSSFEKTCLRIFIQVHYFTPQNSVIMTMRAHSNLQLPQGRLP